MYNYPALAIWLMDIGTTLAMYTAVIYFSSEYIGKEIHRNKWKIEVIETE